MDMFEVYVLFVFLPSLGAILTYGGAIMAAIAFISAMLTDSIDDELPEAERTKQKRVMVHHCALGLLVFALSFFIPSQKEMAILYLAPKILNSETIQNMPTEITRFIEKEVGKNE